MPTGTIIKLVHLSQQTYQATSQLISSHNDKGYGTIRVEGVGDVYFSHDAVPGRRGFDDLRWGQSVEFTLDSDSQTCAKFVNATTAPANGYGPTVGSEESDGTRIRHVVRTHRRPYQPPSITEHPLDGYPRGK